MSPLSANQISESNGSTTPSSQGMRNVLIAIAAVLLSISLWLGLQHQTARPSLTTLAATATPLEQALTNQQPSLVEFYANWCTSCQAMVGDLAALKQEYGDRVNFVMLNVDNSKWLPEVMRYRVDGIPHFVFLDRSGQAIAGVVGEQPRSILDNALAALATDAPLPAAFSNGQASVFQADLSGNADDPRSHGGMPDQL
ncbi:MAG: thioredoxin domain-containing protein [Thermosynechococcaceae cyanobacterium]